MHMSSYSYLLVEYYYYYYYCYHLLLLLLPPPSTTTYYWFRGDQMKIRTRNQVLSSRRSVGRHC